MSDRRQSTYDDSAGFRETYLREIPADRQPLLRGLADWLIELARESHMTEIPDELNRADLAAIAADLRHCAGALYQIAWHGTEVSVDPKNLRLVLLAAELAPKVEELSARLGSAMAT